MAERSGRKAVESLLYSTDRVRILDMVTKMGEMASQALGMAAGVGLRKAAEAAMVAGKAAGKTAKGAGDVLGAFFSGLKGGWNA